VKVRVNAVALAAAEEFRRDSDLFGEAVKNPETQSRMRAAFKAGFQTREPEKNFSDLVARLGNGTT
jgi:hypothetical protein